MKTVVNIPGFGQSENFLAVCADVGKKSFTWIVEVGGKFSEGEVKQETEAIRAFIEERKSEAALLGKDGVLVVCESTSVYHKRLLRMAKKAGCETALVSGEMVKQMRVVTSNDASKSDEKDPYTINLLVKLRKMLTDRQVEGKWAGLRALNGYYECVDRRMTQTKNQIHAYLVELFPDLSFKRDWLFEGKAVRVLMEHYGMDPYAIKEDGQEKFNAKLELSGVREPTRRRLWEDAQRSVGQQLGELERTMLVIKLRDAYEDLKVTQYRRMRVRGMMVALLEALQAQGEVRIQATEELGGAFALARIFAETGPMKDFKAVGQLFRYAGMNLCTHRSGEMNKGEWQSKRGRGMLRKAVFAAILKLVVKSGLYGEYYHGKKAEGKAGPVAMNAVARKYLAMLFGLERSGKTFDVKRVFSCEGEYKKAA